MGAAANDLTTQTAAEFLRLTLPMMSRHRVPVTPENYAVWYNHISGANVALSAAIDRRIDNDLPFTADVNAELYRRFVAEHDLDRVEQVGTDLDSLLRDVGSSLADAGEGASHFEGTLDGLVEEVAARGDLQDIRELLTTLIRETRTMKTATHAMQLQFESKSREIDDLQQQLLRERQRANTDPLTGLYNRFALIERLNEAVRELPEGAEPSLVMLDIDHFKRINDTHGHLIGDRVIRFVAQTLQQNTKGKDTAARYGGEEFTLLLPDTPSTGAASVAESIRHEVQHAKLVRADNRKPLGQITVSAGVATYRAGEDVMEFIDRADRALYRSKNDGRNRVTVD